jgi:DNA modification methylase
MIHCQENRIGMAALPDGCAQLIIADPPYFEVKGAFDFTFPSFDAYLEFMADQAAHYQRLLAVNGTLFLYGHTKRIAYLQVLFDRLFRLENSLVWEKTECQTRRIPPATQRAFAPVTERILMYSREINATSLERLHSDPALFQPIKQHLRRLRSEIMQHLSIPTVTAFERWLVSVGCTTTVGRHCFADSQFELITWVQYERMMTAAGKAHDALRQEYDALRQEYDALRQEYDALRQEYDALRQEYDALRRPFQTTALLTDVLRFSQEAHHTKQYAHPTQKPEGLTRLLIETCSRPNDLVLVPFAGSGVECAVAHRLGRRYVGYEIAAAYAAIATRRVQETATCLPFQ